jgi:ribose 5-phosphate isomerase B
LISVHNHLDPGGDLPDFVVPLARAVTEGTTEREIALVGSDVAEAPCANKITGVRAGPASDPPRRGPGLKRDHMNLICVGGRTLRSYAGWDIREAFRIPDRRV